jgi:hypothetical protein
MTAKRPDGTLLDHAKAEFRRSTSSFADVDAMTPGFLPSALVVA